MVDSWNYFRAQLQIAFANAIKYFVYTFKRIPTIAKNMGIFNDNNSNKNVCRGETHAPKNLEAIHLNHNLMVFLVHFIAQKDPSLAFAWLPGCYFLMLATIFFIFLHGKRNSTTVTECYLEQFNGVWKDTHTSNISRKCLAACTWHSLCTAVKV